MSTRVRVPLCNIWCMCVCVCVCVSHPLTHHTRTQHKPTNTYTHTHQYGGRRIYSFVWRRRIYSFGGGFIHCLAEEDLFTWRRIYSFVWLGRIYSFEGGFIHLSGGGGFIHLSGTPATTTKQSGSVTYLTRLRHCGIVVHFPNPLSLPSPLARRSQ